MEDTKSPRTARDALIIELLGDLEVLHNSIKQLPGEINEATAQSLELIAKSVEEAEKTASDLAKSMDAHKQSVMLELRAEIKESFTASANDTFDGLNNTVSQLQQKMKNIEVSDPKSRRLNTILSFALILTLILSGTAITSIYISAKNKIDDLQSIILK